VELRGGTAQCWRTMPLLVPSGAAFHGPKGTAKLQVGGGKRWKTCRCQQRRRRAYAPESMERRRATSDSAAWVSGAVRRVASASIERRRGAAREQKKAGEANNVCEP